MKTFSLVSGFLAAFLPGAISGQVLAPVQDSYVVPGNGTNFGTVQTLTVGSSASEGLVQFDLTHLPAGITASQIGQATLTLFLDHIGSPGTVTVYVANGSWTEAGVNGTNAPAPGAVVANNVGVATTDTFVTVDATAAVQSWLSGAAANNGFLIFPAAAGTSVQFDSKENTGTSHPGTLAISLISTGSVGPAGPPGSTGPAGANGATGPTGPRSTNGQSVFSVFGTAAVTIAADSPLTLIPGLTASVTVTTGQQLRITSAGGLHSNSTSTTGFTLTDVGFLVDGHLTISGGNGGYVRVTSANVPSFTQPYVYWYLDLALNLSSGNHTIQVVAQGNGIGDEALVSGTTKGDMHDVLQGTLTVQVLNN